MKVLQLVRIAEIKGVRVNYDHLEQIIEWFNDENLDLEISTVGIDKTYKVFNSLDLLIKSRGKKPKIIAISGTKGDQKITYFISMQYCIIDTINRDIGELEYKIIRLMKQSVPLLFKLFPFKWFVWLLILMFLITITAYFFVGENSSFLLIYSLYPIAAFIVAGLYNNYVNGINLIYSYEKTSFWTRKKDDVILLILSTLILVPIGSAIWEYIIKPFLENRK